MRTKTALRIMCNLINTLMSQYTVHILGKDSMMHIIRENDEPQREIL